MAMAMVVMMVMVTMVERMKIAVEWAVVPHQLLLQWPLPTVLLILTTIISTRT